MATWPASAAAFPSRNGHSTKRVQLPYTPAEGDAPRIWWGSGSPEGVVTDTPGSTYFQTNTGAVWVKVSGSGNTGWASGPTGALSLNPGANITALTLTHSLTGANAQSGMVLNTTWNTSGNPVALDINIADSASNPNALAIRVIYAGTQAFNVRKDGQVSVWHANGDVNAYQASVVGDTNSRWAARCDGELRWGPGNATQDVLLERTGVGLLALTGHLTVTASVANTPILASTGFSVTGAGTTALLNLAGTWNTTGNVTGILLNITNTASHIASTLLKLQLAGSDVLAVYRFGLIELRPQAGTVPEDLAFAVWKAGESVPRGGFRVDGRVAISPDGTAVATQVLRDRRTGWTLPTGTRSRAAYDDATVTTQQLAQRVSALLDDLHSTAGHGLIGA